SFDDHFGQLRDLESPRSPDVWQTLIDDWHETFLEIAEFIVEGDGNLPGTLAYRSDVIVERVTDFGLDCFRANNDSGAEAETPGPSDAAPAGAPVPPPEFADASLINLGEL